MIKKVSRSENRKKRHVRIRKKVSGVSNRLRACVYRSNNNFYIQFINDELGKVITGFSTLNKEFNSAAKGIKNKVELAKAFGKFVGEKAREKNISEIVFDRAGYKYHGKIKAIADGMRECGIKF